MKKSANRKPRHDARRAKARSTGARALGPSKPVGPTKPLAHKASLSSPRRRIAHGGRIFSALLDSGSRSARKAIAWLRRAPEACARAIPIPAGDRQTLALLLAPFFILAAAIAANQSIHLGKHLRALIARPVAPIMLPASHETADQIALPSRAATESFIRPAPARQQAANWIKSPAFIARPRSAPDHAAQAPAEAADLLPASSSARFAPDLAHHLLPASTATPVRPPGRILAHRPPERLTPTVAPSLLANATPGWRIASADQYGPMLTVIPPGAMEALVAFDEERDMATRRISLFERCAIPAGKPWFAPVVANTSASAVPQIAPATWFAPAGMSSFGQRLAAAARRQLGEFVIYNDAYRRIAYPRGDVAKLYGVCTDVVIRAYRDLGIDLQVAVQAARVGSGDRNIDHRRTETLRRFFQRAGESLPVTSFVEDYLPGDIVTYARPQNTGTASRSHIAVVSDVIAPSGRPMIVHNRGWGPQLEDALFVDQITGHYRYAGPLRPAPIGEASVAPPATARRAADARARATPPQSSHQTASTTRTVR